MPPDRKRQRLAPQGKVFHKRPPSNKDEFDLLHHPLRKITQGCKKAKAFEAQKLARKLKQLSEAKDEQAGEISELLDAIRAVPHDKLASHALTSYLQSKSSLDLRSHERLAADLLKHPAEDRKIDPKSTEGKAENRILASKHTRAAIEASMAALRLSLGLAGGAPAPSKASVKTAKPVKPSSTPAATPAPINEASSEEEESEAEKADERSAVDDERPDGVYSGSESDEASPPLERPRKPSPALAKRRKRSTADVEVKGSTFLPSLSTGFTLGESDASEYESDEEKGKLGKGKNRMGQRARQALWEKQYGEEANHVKRQGQGVPLASERGRGRGLTERGRGRGDAAQRGGSGAVTARGRGDAGRGDFGANRGRGASYGASHGRDDSPAGRGRGDAGRGGGHDRPPPKPVHPSWAAAAKRKEAEALAMKPQGKKITFE